MTSPILIGIAALAMLIAGCKGSSGDRPIADSTRTMTAPPATKEQASAAVAPTAVAPEVKQLPFDKGTIPLALAYQGDIVGGARWSDANGENTLIVSYKRSAHGEERRDEVFGYLYLADGDSARLLWKIQDLADNYCDPGEGLVSDVVARDLDGDGVAENAFIYNVQGTCDVSPKPFKLMMHSGERKFAIRGTNSVDLGDGPTAGEKKIDPAFDGAPREFRAFASTMWDQTVKRKRLGP